VVTSKKALVAAHGRELLELAKLHNVNYFFEASVGGGIPVLRPLKFDLAGNRITCIRGILNGTTNYILTAMREEKLSLEEALRSAQSKGYAEANPTDDLNGMDAARKLAILADLAWGHEVKAEEIPREGIQNVDLKDVAAAARLGGKVKLICEAEQLADGRIAASVAPQVVMPGSMLYGVDQAFNGVLITGNALGDTMFYGTGAGSVPTASAVVGDVIDALTHSSRRRSIGWSGDPAVLTALADGESRWYVRRGEVSSIEAEKPGEGVCFRVLE
jgi:homoserine dehydrogenase